MTDNYSPPAFFGRQTGPRIMVALNGARRGKSDHPAIPLTAAEIVAEAARCAALGADWLHLHVRDDAGRHSLDPGRYRETLQELSRHLPGLAVQVTTEAAGRYGVADQLHVLDQLRPRAASISVREIARDPELAPRLYRTCAEADTEVQHILYDRSDLHQLEDWWHQGIVPRAMGSVLFVLGRYDPPRPAQTVDLDMFLGALPDGISRWMACAFGPTEQAVLAHAARRGGDLRIGFENNIHRPDGTLAQSNAANLSALLRALTHSPQAKGIPA